MSPHRLKHPFRLGCGTEDDHLPFAGEKEGAHPEDLADAADLFVEGDLKLVNGDLYVRLLGDLGENGRTVIADGAVNDDGISGTDALRREGITVTDDADPRRR